MKRFTLAVVLLFAFVANAAEKTYETGKLVDLQQSDMRAGDGSKMPPLFCLAIQVHDITYLVEHQGRWAWSDKPTELIVGDPVEVRIDGSKLFLKMPKGEYKATITRRERNDARISSCSLPVQVR